MKRRMLSTSPMQTRTSRAMPQPGTRGAGAEVARGELPELAETQVGAVRGWGGPVGEGSRRGAQARGHSWPGRRARERGCGKGAGQGCWEEAELMAGGPAPGSARTALNGRAARGPRSPPSLPGTDTGWAGLGWQGRHPPQTRPKAAQPGGSAGSWRSPRGQPGLHRALHKGQGHQPPSAMG